VGANTAHPANQTPTSAAPSARREAE